jgi:predicted phage terminase large subunit-like protein
MATWDSMLMEKFRAPARVWETPGALAAYLEPRTVVTPALELIDAELVRLLDTPDGRLIISMPPQEGKSTRVAKDFPTWVLKMRPDWRVVTASYGQSLANRNGRAIRRNITHHPELGLTIAPDNGAVHDWQLADHDGGVLSVGVGAGLTGRPADLEIIDDPIKDRKEADSETYRQNVWDWWTDVASTRLAPGAPVVVILTRWHEDDLAGRLTSPEHNQDWDAWRVLNIPAQADHNPNEGEVDALGREPGEYMISARRNKDGTPRTNHQWEALKRSKGTRTWTALYQGRPAPAEGGAFKRDWWQQYTQPLWVQQFNGAMATMDMDAEVIASWDMAFKDTTESDYVVGQVWMRRRGDAYLLDQVRGRWDFVDTCQQFRTLAAKWPQATLKLVEDKANGPAVIAALRRTVPGIVPEEPHGSKEARAAAVSPLVEAGNVYLPSPELAPWVGGFIEEAAAFPNGANDDQVDALSQALNRLLLIPLLQGELVTPDDLDETLAEDMHFLTAAV